jgi:competence protein ComEC
MLRALDVRKPAFAAGVFAAVAYATLAGGAVATVRSVAMAAAAALALALDRPVGAMRCIALAAIVLAVVQPGAAADAGYQLSFVSVIGLVAGGRSPASAGRRAWLARGARAAAAAWIATAPLTAHHFHQVSLASVPANLVVVPLFGAVALAPALLGAGLASLAPGWASWCFGAAALPVSAGVALVRAAGDVGWAAIDVPAPTLVELALLYALLVAMVIWRGRTRRAMVALVLVGLAANAVAWAAVRLGPPGFRAVFLDVGQGDAAVVELPGGRRVLVVDAGGFPGSDFDTGAAIVEPFLRSRKIQSVDALVVSHAHPDHAGGVPHLVRAFEPSEVWVPAAARADPAWSAIGAALREVGVPLRVLAAGDRVAAFPEVEVLHPPRDWPRASPNEGSLVIRVRVGTTSVLFAGDAEAAAEAAMLARGLPEATVLKVPHHGSRTSSSAGFVAAVAPRVAVVSLGAGNRYGHPAPEVTARYERAGARVLRTDRCGAVVAEGDGRALRVSTWRRACEPDAGATTRPPR